MDSRIMLGAAVAAAALLGLAGCSTGDDGGPTSSSVESSGSASDEATAEDTATPDASDDDGSSGVTGLATAETDLGTIVVDADGNTVYQFDSDTQGGDASTCEGQCADNWPPVHGDDGEVELDGVTGEVGSITGIDGEAQLTLDGWPLYYFAGDATAGDTAGQGVNDVWWVLTPAGEPIRG
ncbi:COG4315 family predicted lipoprotein [Agromyces sp. SYSU T0242]|uniref:COG4315 family predicted lipoprotein n=1 Tax=Agromyces litoreus TaxID=3158561 RepID=UPI0033962A52